MPVSRLGAFIDSLQELQLLVPAQLNELCRMTMTQADDPAPLARELVQRKWLTSYQVNHLMKGNGKDLIIGPYRVLDRIGQGGMGQVFKAFHPTMGRVVALKVIKKEKLSHPDAIKRFKKEIEVAGKLEHPNIVRAFDAGQEGTVHYFAMEYVDGIDLRKLVKQNGPLPVLEACDYVRQAAQGLQHAHERGLVHRDIKPPNLLVSRSPFNLNGANPGAPPNMVTRACLKILDMGLARITGADDANQLTRIGLVIGTPEFLAPEQARNSHTVDIRADLYSLGCTFYYLLAGRVPFTGATVGEVLLKHQSDEAGPLDKVRPEMPLQLGLVVKRLMAKKPEERYQTPADLILALTAYNRRAPVRATPVNGKKGTGPLPVAPLARGQGAAAALPAMAALPAENRLIAPANNTAENGSMDSHRAMFARMTEPGDDTHRRRRLGRWLRRLASLTLLLALLAGGWVFWSRLGPEIRNFLQSRPPADKRSEAPAPKDTSSGDPVAKADPGAESKPDTKRPPEPEPKAVVDPKPDPKLDPKPDPKLDPKPPPPLPKKLVIPEPAMQAEAERQIRQKHFAEYDKKRPTDMANLAGILLKEAADAKDNALRYVLLNEARDLAIQGADPEKALQAIDEMDKTFVVVALDLKADALERLLARVSMPPVALLRAILDSALTLADDGVDEDQYDAALRLLGVARSCASKLNTSATFSQINQRVREVSEIQREYNNAKPFAATLLRMPEDTEANFRWGRFLALYKRAWAKGIPLLVQGIPPPPPGNDPKLKAAAEKEQGLPAEPEQQLELANAYWDLGEGEGRNPFARKSLYAHAREWYEKALPGLPETAKGMVEKRLKIIEGTLTKDEITMTDKSPMPSMPVTNPKQQLYDKYMLSARNYYQNSRYVEAAQQFNKALEVKPDDPKAQNGVRVSRYAQHLANGQAALAAREYNRAAREFERALELLPNDPSATTGLLQARRRMGKNQN
jgi:serine/threonine-protein kinase